MALFHYVGAGVFHNGIPARDLLEHEFAALSDELKALVQDGGLYEAAPAAAEPTRPEPQPEPELQAAPKSDPQEGGEHDDATQ